jgi:hypothetical protein
LSVNVTPLGSPPLSLKAGVGDPDVVTEKEPGPPSVNVVLEPEVITMGEGATTVTVAAPLLEIVKFTSPT